MNAFTQKPVIDRKFLGDLRRSAAASANGTKVSHKIEQHTENFKRRLIHARTQSMK